MSKSHDRYGIPYSSPTWVQDHMKAFTVGVGSFFETRSKRFAEIELSKRLREAQQDAAQLDSILAPSAGESKVRRL